MEYTKNSSWAKKGSSTYLHYPENDKGVCVQVNTTVKGCRVDYGEDTVLKSGPEVGYSFFLRAQVRASKETLMGLLTNPKMCGLTFNRRDGDYLRVSTTEYLLFTGTDVDSLGFLLPKVKDVIANRHPWLEELTSKDYVRAVVNDICSTIMTFHNMHKDAINKALSEKKEKEKAGKPSPFQLLDGGKKDDD